MDLFHQIIGEDADTILWWQMIFRGILVFICTLLLVRFGGRRVFGKNTSFDIVLGVILGSIMSRALTANAQFIPTVLAATTLVVMHWLFASIAQRSRTFGHFIKGTEVQIVSDGEIQEAALKRTNLTEHDLFESLRSNGSTDDVGQVKAAYLERSGNVSVIKK